ncbi:MAG: zf-HC2 domain-containing protein [Bryobacteraceae bacterium]|jgi:hypothetical protein
MNCADLEILLCDYVDGTLAAGLKADLERHLAQCAACAEMARDVQAAVGFMERAAEVEPPPELLTRILFELPSAHHARARQPGGIRKLLRGWLQPVLQPRFAMGFAMTILSFSLLARFAGISPGQLKAEDFKPAHIWRRLDEQVYRGYQRAVKFYGNLRLVYEVQTQLREWTQKEQELKGRAGSADDQQAASPERTPEATRPAAKDRGGTNGPEVRNTK